MSKTKNVQIEEFAKRKGIMQRIFGDYFDYTEFSYCGPNEKVKYLKDFINSKRVKIVGYFAACKNDDGEIVISISHTSTKDDFVNSKKSKEISRCKALGSKHVDELNFPLSKKTLTFMNGFCSFENNSLIDQFNKFKDRCKSYYGKNGQPVIFKKSEQ